MCKLKYKLVYNTTWYWYLQLIDFKTVALSELNSLIMVQEEWNVMAPNREFLVVSSRQIRSHTWPIVTKSLSEMDPESSSNYFESISSSEFLVG